MGPRIVVVLTEEELARARSVAHQRNRPDLENKHGLQGDGFDEHFLGCCGETAVARACGIPWSGSVNKFKGERDVGPYEVRTRSKLWYELLVRKDDPDDAPFALVVGKPPEMIILGQLLGKRAKQEKWLQTHGGREEAYFVPQRLLEPFSRGVAEKGDAREDRAGNPAAEGPSVAGSNPAPTTKAPRWTQGCPVPWEGEGLYALLDKINKNEPRDPGQEG